MERASEFINKMKLNKNEEVRTSLKSTSPSNDLNFPHFKRNEQRYDYLEPI